MRHVLIKFGSLKIDIRGDAMMCADAIYHQTHHRTSTNVNDDNVMSNVRSYFKFTYIAIDEV